MIKIKKAENNHRVRFSCDENGNEIPGTSTPSFNKKNPLWAESEEWLAIPGNVILPQFTDEELAVQDSKEKSDAYDSFVSDRNSRIKEADKWELPTIIDRFGVTIEQVKEYKEFLIAMNETLTIDSTLEKLQNPNFPDKLIEGLL